MNFKIGRKLLVWFAGACLFVLVLLTAFRVYGYFRLQKAADWYEKEIGPLNTESYAPLHVAELENAAIVLQGGAYAVVMTAEERAFLRKLIEKRRDTWDEKSIVRARSIVQRQGNEAAYQVMVQAIPLEKSSFNLKYELAWYMPIPNYLDFMQAKFILGMRARLSLIDGDTANAFQTIAVEERMAAALLHEPVLISCLIGASVQRDYDRLVQEMLFRSDLKMLLAMERQLQHLRSMAAPIKRIFAAEGAATYETLLKKYPDEVGAQISQDRSVRWFYRSNRRLFLSHLLDSAARFAKQSGAPIASVSEPPARSKWDLEQIVVDALGPENGYPAIGRIQATNSEMILAELSVRICLDAKQKGGYPRDLSGFNAPISPYTGEPVHYAVQSDGSAVLSYPEADRFWDKTYREPVPRKPLFVWKLPSIRVQ